MEKFRELSIIQKIIVIYGITWHILFFYFTIAGLCNLNFGIKSFNLWGWLINSFLALPCAILGLIFFKKDNLDVTNSPTQKISNKFQAEQSKKIKITFQQKIAIFLIILSYVAILWGIIFGLFIHPNNPVNFGIRGLNGWLVFGGILGANIFDLFILFSPKEVFPDSYNSQQEIARMSRKSGIEPMSWEDMNH